MKYMNKVQIIKKHAVENVFREIHILQTLEHPFLVNLWFTFQDREDIFMVLDLMLGACLHPYLHHTHKHSHSPRTCTLMLVLLDGHVYMHIHILTCTYVSLH